MDKIKKLHPKTLENLERYRKVLLKSPTIHELKKELGYSERVFRNIKKLYKELYYNEEAMEQKRNETIEKSNLIKRKAFNDYITGNIPARDFVVIDKHCQDTDARFGFGPTEKLDINLSGGLDVNTKLRGFEAYLKSLELEKEKKLKHKDES